VLIVEDEVRLAENLAAALRDGGGFAVDHAADGLGGELLAQQGCYDVVILDLMLPGQSGQAMLRNLRAKRNATPVLVLTAHPGKQTVIELLNAGADDYLGKPFDLGELMARVKALIRRGKGASHPTLHFAGVELSTLEQVVRRDGRLVDLSPTEYRILEYLMHRPSVVVSRKELLEHLYDYNWEHHSNIIEAHISNLRRKIDEGGLTPLIETLRYRGYRLSSGGEPA
jgi:two-component system response regulator PhoP